MAGGVTLSNVLTLKIWFKYHVATLLAMSYIFKYSLNAIGKVRDILSPAQFTAIIDTLYSTLCVKVML